MQSDITLIIATFGKFITFQRLFSISIFPGDIKSIRSQRRREEIKVIQLAQCLCASVSKKEINKV